MSQLPEELVEKIEKELSTYPLHKLKAAREELSRRYREGISQRMTTPEERLSYVATRMPATLAVIERILAQVPLEGKTLLDLGAGPGTAYFAAGGLKKITHVEQDPHLIALGKKLQPVNTLSTWVQGDFNQIPFEWHDISLFSYSFNESVDLNLITKGWEASETLIVIEPGTPRGFSHILKIRDHIIGLGGSILAPCPHAHPCPLSSPDWCHFAVRVARFKWHKELKEGTLGYEDEKYSYLIASKKPSTTSFSRLLAPPEKHSGHLRLRLCSPSGLELVTLSKKEGELYKQARKLDWGDFIRSQR